MGRLTRIAPQLSKVAPRVGWAEDVSPERMRDANAPWRKWYKTERWRRLRWSILVRDGFTCRLCGRLEGNTKLLVCDHVKPHRGVEQLFWDEANLACMCKSCHDSVKQRDEQASMMARGIWD